MLTGGLPRACQSGQLVVIGQGDVPRTIARCARHEFFRRECAIGSGGVTVKIKEHVFSFRFF